MTSATPPGWAEALLRLLLEPADRETVSGDLLEEYRESATPSYGHRAANRWYLRQVAGFLWRSYWMWAAAFSGVFVVRQAFDWRMPTSDFATRSAITSYAGIAIVLCAGFSAAWRTRSWRAGAVAGAAITTLAAILSAAGVLAMFAVWHDPQTLRAIRNVGGLAEDFTLPITLAVPGFVLGSLAGVASRLVSLIVRGA